jgi:multidrug efflux pump subunit AcrA (membrane-fusion protein)
MVDEGDMATPGKALLEIEDRSELKLSFDVPQEDLPQVREGLPVRFRSNGKKRTAEVTLLHPSLNRARMMRAEVRLSGSPPENLSTGAYVPASVIVDSLSDVALVPRSSVIESPSGEAYVFVVRDGTLHKEQVERLGAADDTIAVKGVQAGARVVRDTYLSWARLSAGEKVEAVQ